MGPGQGQNILWQGPFQALRNADEHDPAAFRQEGGKTDEIRQALPGLPDVGGPQHQKFVLQPVFLPETAGSGVKNRGIRRIWNHTQRIVFQKALADQIPQPLGGDL